jgi:hypothetical protein
MGIRASGHQGIRVSGIRASGHQGIRPSGHRALGILAHGHRLYSLSRFQQRSAFCGNCYMKTAFYIYFIDIYAALY